MYDMNCSVLQKSLIDFLVFFCCKIVQSPPFQVRFCDAAYHTNRMFFLGPNKLVLGGMRWTLIPMKVVRCDPRYAT